MKILVINGPNLNMLGIRERSVYGDETLEQINMYISEKARNIGAQTDFFQSNCEGAIIDAIHSVQADYDGCVINAGAYTHYSYAIYDAIKCVGKPFAEVHLSDINNREEFRRKSVISPACAVTICGEGKDGYVTAIKNLLGC